MKSLGRILKSLFILTVASIVVWWFVRRKLGAFYKHWKLAESGKTEKKKEKIKKLNDQQREAERAAAVARRRAEQAREVIDNEMANIPHLGDWYKRMRNKRL